MDGLFDEDGLMKFMHDTLQYLDVVDLMPHAWRRRRHRQSDFAERWSMEEVFNFDCYDRQYHWRIYSLSLFLGVLSVWGEIIAMDVKITLLFGLSAVEMASRLSSIDAIRTTKCSNFQKG